MDKLCSIESFTEDSESLTDSVVLIDSMIEFDREWLVEVVPLTEPEILPNIL